MYYGFLQFEVLPTIGFAHHFYTDNCHTLYGRHHTGFEVAYITDGSLNAELYGKTLPIPTGSVIVLFRELPILLHSDSYHAHCTVHVDVPHTLSLQENISSTQTQGLLLPFVSLPCPENELIKKKLFSIISRIGVSREENAFRCSLDFLEILNLLNTVATRSQTPESVSTNISYKVKQYVTTNMDRPLSLADISTALGKTPNYINRLFREANGITIIQYIRREKVHRIVSLISKQQLSFKTACENVGITDTAYGYRLFKKYTGVTPNQYLQSALHT